MGEKLICDPANCPTGKRVDEALNAIGGLRQDLGNTRQDYKETQKAFSETHDALIEQTATLSNVVQNMERDRAERKDIEEKLFNKTNANTVAIESKADKDEVNNEFTAVRKEKVSRNGVLLVVGIITLVFGALTFIANMG
jgi:hypothetical protein